MVHPKDMHPKSPDVVWAFLFQSAFAARMAYRRYLKLKILEMIRYKKLRKLEKR